MEKKLKIDPYKHFRNVTNKEDENGNEDIQYIQ